MHSHDFLTHSRGRFLFDKRLPLGALILASFFICLFSCSSSRNAVRHKPVIYDVAPKTTRSDIITDTIIILNGYNFTVQLANADRTHSALITDWRMTTEVYQIDDEQTDIEVRDRAILHLSPRGVQSTTPRTLVASDLEFQLQTKSEEDKWIDNTPSPPYKEEYAAIVNDIRNRVRKRGYVF